MELFPENLLSYLPAESREKVLLLDEARNAAMAANKAAGDALFEAYERRDALTVKAQYAVEGSVSGLGRKLSDEDREAIYAVDWLRYSKGRYTKEQAAAKSERRGIWRGEFEQPCMARAARTKRAPAC